MELVARRATYFVEVLHQDLPVPVRSTSFASSAPSSRLDRSAARSVTKPGPGDGRCRRRRTTGVRLAARTAHRRRGLAGRAARAARRVALRRVGAHRPRRHRRHRRAWPWRQSHRAEPASQPPAAFVALAERTGDAAERPNTRAAAAAAPGTPRRLGRSSANGGPPTSAASEAIELNDAGFGRGNEQSVSTIIVSTSSSVAVAFVRYSSTRGVGDVSRVRRGGIPSRRRRRPRRLDAVARRGVRGRRAALERRFLRGGDGVFASLRQRSRDVRGPFAVASARAAAHALAPTARRFFSRAFPRATPTLRDARLRSPRSKRRSCRRRHACHQTPTLSSELAPRRRRRRRRRRAAGRLSHPLTTGSAVVSSPRARPPPARAAGSAPGRSGPRRPMRGATAATRRPWRRPGRARSSLPRALRSAPASSRGVACADAGSGTGSRRVWTRPRRARQDSGSLVASRRRPSRPRADATRARGTRAKARPPVHPRPLSSRPTPRRCVNRAETPVVVDEMSRAPPRASAATGAREPPRRHRRAPPRARPHRPRRRRRGHRVSTRDGFLLSADSAPRHNALVSWPPSATVFFGIPRVSSPTTIIDQKKIFGKKMNPRFRV